MNVKDSIRLGFVLLPVLSAGAQFGTALVCGFVFLLLVLLSQALSVFLGQRFPRGFRSFFLALVVGTFYTVLAEVLRVIDPAMVQLLAFGLPMTCFAVFLTLLNEPIERLEDPAARMTWSLVQGSAGFFVVVPTGFLREILGTGSLSISAGNPIRIFAAGEGDAASGPVFLALAPAGIFLLAGLVFLVVNILRRQESEEDKSWES